MTKRVRGAARLTHRDISAAEEARLCLAVQAGDHAAARTLLEAHEPLLMRFAMSCRGRGVLVDDLLQAARIGLWKGIHKWRAKFGKRLMTYAVHHVRSQMAKAVVTTGSSIRLPYDEHDALNAARRGRAPETAELTALRRLLTTASLDVAPGEGPETWVDMKASPDEGAELAFIEADLVARRKAIVRKALDTSALTPMDRTLIERRWLSIDPPTMEEIAAERGVSRQNIQQMEARAMKTLGATIRLKVKTLDGEMWGGT